MKCFFGAHKRCSTNKHRRYAKGSGLELLHGFKSGPNFNREGTYQVCESIQRKLIQMQLRSDITVPDSCFELLQIPDEDKIRIPMLKESRSMNLSNAAAVIVYDAWRQLGFPNAV